MGNDAVDEFLAVLEKSRLLTPEQIDDARLAAQQCSDPKGAAKALVQRGLLTRWQAGQLLAGRSSFFLGKYKLIEPIGRGGMGGVFLGQHTTMNRRVALKILSREVGKDPASLERFLDEARAIAALDHPNIVQAYSVDHDADRYYLVMEYIDGRDLKQLVEEEGLPDCDTAADYIRQAADGLAHGHGRNMIHCDIKPSNLLANSQGVLKIVDLGLTRLNGRSREEVNEGRGARDEGRGTSSSIINHQSSIINGQGERILGSVDYLAPEQALGSPDFDHRADIYSLGCTLYFLLTGHPPFPEGTLSERIVKHQVHQPQSIHRQRRDAPAGLVRICEKMMAKRPEDRFQSAEEVSRALAEWKLREPEQKRTVALKTAEPLEELASGTGVTPVARASPSIDVDAESGLNGVTGAGKAERTRKAGLWRTRRRAVAAWAVAGLALAAAAATVSWVIGSGSALTERDRTPAGLRAGGPEEGRPVGRRPRPTDARGDRHSKAPTDNRADRKPPAEVPPAEGPPAQGPPAAKQEPGARDHDPPEPKPEPKEAEPKGPEQGPREPGEGPAKQKEPFRQLAKAVDLPVLRVSGGADGQSGVAVALGTLQLEPNAVCIVELKGGKDAVPGNRHLALDREQGNNAWLIRLDADDKPNADDQGTDLARLWLEEQTLKFQWLSGAGRARGNCLRNCGLLVGVDQQSHWLPLSPPKAVDPLVLDLDGGVARISLPTAEWMPKIGTLRLQITGLEGPFPQHTLKPADGISENGRVEVLFSGEKLPGVRLQVALVGRGRAASAEVTALYQLADRVQRQFKAMEAVRLSGEFYVLQNRWQSTLDKLSEQDPRRPDARRQVDLLKESLEQLKALGELYQQIHKRGKIHFRVFRAVDDRQIELFTTQATAPEGPGKNGPRESR